MNEAYSAFSHYRASAVIKMMQNILNYPLFDIEVEVAARAESFAEMHLSC
jgi:hypothetical protein